MRLCVSRIVIAAAFLAAAAVPSFASDSAPDPAAAAISSFYTSLTGAMKRGKTLGLPGRAQKIAPAIDAAFDIPLMAQFTVGPSWSSLSQADKDAVIAAFRRYTIADYAHNFGSFGGQHFVTDPNAVVRGPDHIVHTQLVLEQGDPVTLNYRMRQVGTSWKIVDVFLNGFVSELSMRRSDFASTVASGGAPALAAKLNALAQDMK